MPPFRQPVSSDEEGWEAPDYFKPESSSDSSAWKAPDYFTPEKETKKPSEFKARASKAASDFVRDVKEDWSKASEPLTDAPTRVAERLSRYINPEGGTKGARGIGSAFVEGLGHAVSGLTSPVNLGLAALTGGSSMAEKAGSEEIAEGLHTGARVLSAPVAAEGAKHVYKGIKDKDWVEGLSGALEAGTGALGMKSRVPRTIESGRESAVRSPRPLDYVNKSGEKSIIEQPKPTDIPLKADNVGDYIKKNPDAKMADVEKFIKDIKQSPEAAKTSEIPIKQTVKAAIKTPTELSPELEAYDKKQGMAQPLSDEELTQKSKTFNPFDKTAKPEESQVKQPTAKYMYDWPDMATETQGPEQYQIEGGRLHGSSVGADTLRKEGIEIPEKTAEAVKPQSRGAWKAPDYFKPEERTSEEDLTKGFGGSGHPESADYVSKVLSDAGNGDAGLKIEDKEGFRHVVYRNQKGEPIAATKIVTGPDGKNMIQDIAADKNKGLLTGRAMKAIGDKLNELGATESSGTTSSDAQNFLSKMKDRMSKAVDIKAPLRDLRDIPKQTPHGNWMDVEHLDKLQKAFGELKDDPVQKFDSPESRVAADKLKESINKEGIIQPIRVVVDDSGKPTRLSEGRHRIEALKDLRFKDAPVKLVNEAGTPLSFSDSENAINKLKAPATEPQGEVTQMHGGLGSIGGETPKQPSTGPHGPVLDKLFSSLEESKGLSEAQSQMYKKEQARRFAAFAGVKEEGVAGAAKSLSKLKGQYEKIEPLYGKLQLEPQETDQLFTAVKQARITEGEKARGYTALFKLMNGESVPQRNELAILDHVFGNNFASRITEMHGGLGAVGLKISKVANTMKSLQNSLSLAAPLRHGIGLVARKEFGPAFAEMFKYFAKPEYFNAAMDALEKRPNYMLSREAGLFTAKPSSLMNSEEEFLNSYVGMMPGIRQVVGASQRGYTGFLNKLRSDTFDSMIKQAKALGHETATTVGDQVVPSKETKAIARYINNATGRGDLPGGLNKLTNELNVLLWSPRMISSRINMLANPKIYMDLPKGMRLEGLKSLFGIAALGTAIDTLGAYGGAKVSTNILSTDFGKSRFGTKLIDPWGGFQQYVVGAARFLAGKTDSNMPTSRLDIAGRFLANKESPVASLAHTLLTAKKFTGKSDDPATAGNFTTQYGEKTNIQGEIGKRFTPIFIQDLEDLMKNEPDWSENVGLNTVMGAASLAGMSQNYKEKKSSRLRLGSMKLGR
jgi:hypothetical protein